MTLWNGWITYKKTAQCSGGGQRPSLVLGFLLGHPPPRLFKIIFLHRCFFLLIRNFSLFILRTLYWYVVCGANGGGRESNLRLQHLCFSPSGILLAAMERLVCRYTLHLHTKVQYEYILLLLTLITLDVD